jgi:PRTRC genetic system protein C
MALAVANMQRVFKYNKIDLDDPNPNLTPDQVLTFYSNTYPALTTATCSGPTIEDGLVVFEFQSTVGTKG